MPPRRRASGPPPIDVEAIKSKLAEGKIVRVGITRSAQFPEGGTGRVRSVGDPEVDGDEYVRVELSLNGTRDILPFTPADLTPAVRGRPPAQFPVTSVRPTPGRPAPDTAPRPTGVDRDDRPGSGVERPPSPQPAVSGSAPRPAAAVESHHAPAAPVQEVFGTDDAEAQTGQGRPPNAAGVHHGRDDCIRTRPVEDRSAVGDQHRGSIRRGVAGASVGVRPPPRQRGAQPGRRQHSRRAAQCRAGPGGRAGRRTGTGACGAGGATGGARVAAPAGAAFGGARRGRRAVRCGARSVVRADVASSR